ncbi:MAG: tetratricopeptide repeat protein, partial [Calditrichaeota bacterium]|nr:tetratricopeptide repeat protein [Calditrichota bacterium]
MRLFIILIVILVSCSESGESGQIDFEKRIQIVTVLGDTVFSNPNPTMEQVNNAVQAKFDSEKQPDNPEPLIWYGRRMAYTGNYRKAIDIYSTGINKFPTDARFYRHRGHRYISIRQFDRAISDLEKAAELVDGKPDEIEADGLPNARNIPTSTLESNIWYHLGLAYFVKGKYESALNAYRQGLLVSKNPDMLSATLHWMYMTLRRLNRLEEAVELLEPLETGMDIIENQAYYQLCLFYKDESRIDSLQLDNATSQANDA